MRRQVVSRALLMIYRRLAVAMGPQHWWPAKTPFEMMVGAILTQATAWHNVEQAIAALRRARLLTPKALTRASLARLQAAIRPAGYFRQKARRVRRFASWYVRRSAGGASRMFGTPWRALREELLRIPGIGEETADSMLLYAGRQPVFVVDAYTRRIFWRHALIRRHATYTEIQALVMQRWPHESRRFNEFHALLVETGKRFCHRRAPACEQCPLDPLPHRRSEPGTPRR